MSNRRYLALFQKITDNTSDMRSCIILMQNPQSSNLWSLLVNLFLKRIEDLYIVNDIYYCLQWNYMLVNDTLSILKHAQHDLPGQFLLAYFSGLRRGGCPPDLTFTLAFCISSHVITLDKKLQSLRILCTHSFATSTCHSICSHVRKCSTHVEQMWRICKCLLRIRCIDDLELWTMFSAFSPTYEDRL